jgi:hypothetical protein
MKNIDVEKAVEEIVKHFDKEGIYRVLGITFDDYGNNDIRIMVKDQQKKITIIAMDYFPIEEFDLDGINQDVVFDFLDKLKGQVLTVEKINEFRAKLIEEDNSGFTITIGDKLFFIREL